LAPYSWKVRSRATLGGCGILPVVASAKKLLLPTFERRFIPRGYSGYVIEEVWAQNELIVISPSAFFLPFMTGYGIRR
jgi:hypothetical protein